MSALTVLKQVRKLLSKPNRWVKGRLRGHRTRNGSVVGVGKGKPANCHCVLGAISHVPGDSGSKELARDVIRSVFFLPQTIATWNDIPETTHADVLNTLDRAIKAAQ